MEFINSKITNRKKLFVKLAIGLSTVLAYFLLQYFTESEEYKTGAKTSRYSISYNNLLFIITASIIILFSVSTASIIVLHIMIDKSNDLFKITFIDRFRLKPITKTVTLSTTQLQVEKTIDKGDNEYYTLFLINPRFGTIKINGMDFGNNIYTIIHEFEQMRYLTAAKLRQKRIKRKKLTR